MKTPLLEPSESAAGAPEAKAPLLSICILSHNRGPQVDALLLYLRANLAKRHGSRIELTVVNNCSTDDTATRLARHASAAIRIIDRAQLLPTAEENMMRSLEFCRGEYVWFLGDDDYPNTDAVDDLMALLESAKADLVIANTASITESGKVIVDQIMDMRAPHVRITIESLIASAGLLAVLAGISRLIFRRTAVDHRRGLTFLDIQAIYSHVFWFISEFADKTVILFNRPFLKYTTLSTQRDVERFRKVQAIHQVGRYYYWGIGLAKPMARLIADGVVEPDTFYRAFELYNNGTRGRMLDFMIWSCYSQLLASVKWRGVEAVAQDDYSGFRDLTLSIDPSYYPLFAQLDQIFLLSKAPGHSPFKFLRAYALSRQFVDVWKSLTDGDRAHHVLFRGLVGDFRIYRGPAKWFAVHRTIASPAPDVFRLDPETILNPFLLVADTRPLLEKLVHEHDARERQVIAASYVADGSARGICEQMGLVARASPQADAAIELVARALFERNAIIRQATFFLWIPYVAARRCAGMLRDRARKIVSLVHDFKRL